MTEIKCIKWKNLEGITIRNEYIQIVVLPRLGGKIASVIYRENGFELVAKCKTDSYNLPQIDSDFSKYDASGLDDAFPSINKVDIVFGNKEVHYPDHGEIWSSSFEYRIEGEVLYLYYESERFGYSYEKTFSIGINKINISYKIKNLKKEPFPCLWAFHGLVRYEDDMELFYCEDVESFENVLESNELGSVGKHFSFHNGKYDFSKVPNKESKTMVKYYLDKKVKNGLCGYRYPSQGMECVLKYDADKLPYLGVWITAGGFRGDYNCALEPTNGYYDDIRIAKKNGSLQFLKKETPLIFNLELLLREIE